MGERPAAALPPLGSVRVPCGAGGGISGGRCARPRGEAAGRREEGTGRR